jgi:hypothetical protein
MSNLSVLRTVTSALFVTNAFTSAKATSPEPASSRIE